MEGEGSGGPLSLQLFTEPWRKPGLFYCLVFINQAFRIAGIIVTVKFKI